MRVVKLNILIKYINSEIAVAWLLIALIALVVGYTIGYYF